jgi:hypothetical protein
LRIARVRLRKNLELSAFFCLAHYFLFTRGRGDAEGSISSFFSAFSASLRGKEKEGKEQKKKEGARQNFNAPFFLFFQN